MVCNCIVEVCVCVCVWYDTVSVCECESVCVVKCGVHVCGMMWCVCVTVLSSVVCVRGIWCEWYGVWGMMRCVCVYVYLLLLVSSSVPLLQNSVGLGAARGLHSIITWPPLAAGTSFLTGWRLKSGAWTGGRTGDEKEGRGENGRREEEKRMRREE